MRMLPRCRPLLAIVVGCLLLVACDNFERNAYRTLKVTKVEYELLQEEAARAFLDGRLTQEQWDRFAVAGNRFIAAHTLAADLMKTYQQTRRARGLAPAESRAEQQALESQVSAALARLPVLLADLRALLESFERTPPTPPQEPDPGQRR